MTLTSGKVMGSSGSLWLGQAFARTTPFEAVCPAAIETVPLDERLIAYAEIRSGKTSDKRGKSSASSRPLCRCWKDITIIFMCLMASGTGQGSRRLTVNVCPWHSSVSGSGFAEKRGTEGWQTDKKQWKSAGRKCLMAWLCVTKIS